MDLTTCMLADGARVGSDGKLYIFGGRWDRIYANSLPTIHPTMTVVLVLQLDYGEALEDHHLEVSLHTADGAAVGPRAIALVRVGHPPELKKGEPISVPMAIELPMITFTEYGKYEWLVAYDDQPPLGRLPLTIARSPVSQLMPGFSVPPPLPERDDDQD